MAEPLFVRASVAEDARRVRRHADPCDELLLRRLAEPGEPPADFAGDVELTGEEAALIETARYHAAAERAGAALGADPPRQAGARRAGGGGARRRRGDYELTPSVIVA